MVARQFGDSAPFRGRRLSAVAVGMAGEHLARLGVRDVYWIALTQEDFCRLSTKG